MMGREDPGELLRRHHLRATPQRRAILEAFEGTAAEHLSAEQVHARAARRVPDLGRGTVYATLAELSEVGLLGSFGTADPVRYETNVAAHDHFQCRVCERLFDVELGGERLRRRRLEGFAIESLAVHAEGTCRDCRDYLQGLTDGAERIISQPALMREALAPLAGARVASPLGELGLAASAEGIVRIAFEDHADFALITERVRSRRGPGAARARLSAVASTLERYFDGDRAAPTDLIDWRLPGVDRRVRLEAVQRIPYAGSQSYVALGEDLPAYESGRLLGSNPLALLVPCHRVSRGLERTESYVGGLERVRLLHDLEARPERPAGAGGG